MYFSVFLIGRKGFNVHSVDTVENAFLNIRVGLFKLPNKLLNLLALAAKFVRDVLVLLGNTARAADKFKTVISAPRYNVVLVNTVHRADKLHSLIVETVELGYHTLKLRAVEHRHNGSFDNV